MSPKKHYSSLVPKLLVFLLISSSLAGVSGCGSSECREVKKLEAPAYETLLESEKLLSYWENLARIERESKGEVCADTVKLNQRTMKVEKSGEVCWEETGVNTQKTLKAVQNAQARYEDSFDEWSKIIKLYPDCFEPEKIIRSNP